MLDERVLAVLARLEAEDADERERGVPSEQRSRQVAPTTGRFLFALVASNAGVEVLELGGSRGYSTIWLAAGEPCAVSDLVSSATAQLGPHPGSEQIVLDTVRMLITDEVLHVV